MRTDLPLFEGVPAALSSLRLSGRSAERVGSLDLGEDVVLVVRAFVAGVDHQQTEDGLERRHALRAEAITVLSADDGTELLDTARRLSDQRYGLQVLDFDVDPVTGEIEGDE